MEPFENDLEKEKYYADLLHVNVVDSIEDITVEEEMEADLREFNRVGSDLGIFPKSCKALVTDPRQLTRWILGEDRLHNF